MTDTQSIILSASTLVAGWLFGGFFKSFKKIINRARISRLRKEFNKTDFKNDIGGIICVASGVPYWDSSHIFLSRTGPDFYYPIPEEYRDKLNDKGFFDAGCFKKYKQGESILEEHTHNFKQTDNCLDEHFAATDEFNDGFGCFGTKWNDATKAEILEIAKSVAEELLKDICSSKPRFNGALFGVGYVNPVLRIGEEEKPAVDIRYYVTNYFTFRVFASYYQKHKQEFFDKYKNERLPYEKLAYPFLSSFGVASLMVVSYNDLKERIAPKDGIILGRRSNEVIVDPNVYHFSMNEALSLGDVDNNGIPNLELAAIRGYQEENGIVLENGIIRDINVAEIDHHKFLDFIFDKNKCEMGVNCLWRIKLNHQSRANQFIQQFKLLRKLSKDGHVETTDFKMITVGDIEKFIKENQNTDKEKKISWGLNFSLHMLHYRYARKVLW